MHGTEDYSGLYFPILHIERIAMGTLGWLKGRFPAVTLDRFMLVMFCVSFLCALAWCFFEKSHQSISLILAFLPAVVVLMTWVAMHIGATKDSWSDPSVFRPSQPHTNHLPQLTQAQFNALLDKARSSPNSEDGRLARIRLGIKDE